jgi:hypothetical protein
MKRNHRVGRQACAIGTGRTPHVVALLCMAAAIAAASSGDVTAAPASGGHVSAAMECTQLAREDFSRIEDFPTTIMAAQAERDDGHAEEYCSVKGYIQPQIQFEMRLPTRTWNGRYLQTGCGGTCGQVNIQDCNDALAQNFAVAAQNMGHVSFRDGLWASDPALRQDYGPRSTHAMAVVAKVIIERYYGRQVAHSYLRGCSTGGREGLLAALHWPLDFNGIVAGDPAFPSRQGGIMNNWIAQHLNTDAGVPVFSEEKLAFLNARVLASCDAIDGLEDGIVEDPRNCDFDLDSVARCAADREEADCLTGQQIEAARKLYDGPRSGVSGERLYPGWVVFGSEKSWSPALNINYAEQFLRFMAFAENPPLSYTYRNFNFDTDVQKLEPYAAVYDPVAPHTDPDLSAFHAAGGKLIVYHGWADATVSPLTSIDFYAEIAGKAGGIDKIKDWYRLYMVPGMFHCRGGDVPDRFDLLASIVAWVEDGRAPEAVIARQMDGEKVVRSRPLYPYPAVARYSGAGDVDDAANWQSLAPTSQHEDDIKWVWDPD